MTEGVVPQFSFLHVQKEVALLKKIINRTNGKILGSIIKMNRLHQNMSQKALSEGICVSSYLSRIENAEISPSEQVISELFEALHIRYDDSDDFMEEGKSMLEHFLDELNFNEFSVSMQIFEEIERRETQFRHSPLIIDYTIAKLAFYCTRKERDIFDSTRQLLASVEELMSGDQKYKYYLYSGIDQAKIHKDYTGSLETLARAKSYGRNGHLFYWFGYSYLAMGNTIRAFEMFSEALNRYVKEANLLSIIASYERIGLTYFRAGSYLDGLDYLNRGIKIAKKANARDYIATYSNNIAWGLLMTGDYGGAIELGQMPEQSILSETSIHFAIIDFLANLEMENPMVVSSVRETFLNHGSDVMQAFGELMLNTERIDWQAKLIDDEAVLKKLIEASEPVNFELAKYLKLMLMRYYKGKRKYKEALEVLHLIG